MDHRVEPRIKIALVLLVMVSVISAYTAADSPSAPRITEAYVDPLKVVPGDTMLVSAAVEDDYGIASVMADMGGIETIELGLVGGTIYDGLWQEQWLVHDTEVKDYITTITATNVLGLTAAAEVLWSDPVTVLTADTIYEDSTNPCNIQGSVANLNDDDLAFERQCNEYDFFSVRTTNITGCQDTDAVTSIKVYWTAQVQDGYNSNAFIVSVQGGANEGQSVYCSQASTPATKSSYTRGVLDCTPTTAIDTIGELKSAYYGFDNDDSGMGTDYFEIDYMNVTVEHDCGGDTTPPSQSNWDPAKGSTISTTSPTITFDTDENAWCKWSL
ncbi:MAG: hypothetical protein V3R93_06285, partial [Candidatus Hydrothermarchaeaceae archaeon]